MLSFNVWMQFGPSILRIDKTMTDKRESMEKYYSLNSYLAQKWIACASRRKNNKRRNKKSTHSKISRIRMRSSFLLVFRCSPIAICCLNGSFKVPSIRCLSIIIIHFGEFQPSDLSHETQVTSNWEGNGIHNRLICLLSIFRFR